MNFSPRLQLGAAKVAKSPPLVCWELDPGPVGHVHAVTACLCLGEGRASSCVDVGPPVRCGQVDVLVPPLTSFLLVFTRLFIVN